MWGILRELAILQFCLGKTSLLFLIQYKILIPIVTEKFFSVWVNFNKLHNFQGI